MEGICSRSFFVVPEKLIGSIKFDCLHRCRSLCEPSVSVYNSVEEMKEALDDGFIEGT